MHEGVVQLAYLPAALRRDGMRSSLGDPLFDVRHPDRPDALLPEGMTSAPERIRQELKALRRRIRAAYSEQLLSRARAAVQACRALGAEIVMLPEYSIPFDLLEPLAQAASEVVLIAGTHAVEREALEPDAAGLQVYERLGWPCPPRLRESVCPVLHGGKLIRLLVSPKLEACAFLAVPSLTPYPSLPEFHGKADVDARRAKRPVLYCNHADFGGSGLFIDEQRALPFPEGAGSLGKDDEGILVADLQMELVPAGRFTGMSPQPATPWPEPPPERLQLSHATLISLSEADALPALLDAFPGRILVDSGTEMAVHRERARLTYQVETAALTQRVEDLVAGGLGSWIQLTTAPESPELPPFKQESGLTGDTQAQFVLEPLQRTLAIRAVMHRDKQLWRLTADFFGSSTLGHPDQVRQFAWMNAKRFLKLSRWNREVATRDVPLPTLVRLLLDPPRGDDKLLKLAELGFPDALQGAELLRLERRYGGLSKTEPRRLLDRMEWMAREPGHLGGEMARLQIAGVYADATGSGSAAGKKARRARRHPRPRSGSQSPRCRRWRRSSTTRTRRRSPQSCSGASRRSTPRQAPRSSISSSCSRSSSPLDDRWLSSSARGRGGSWTKKAMARGSYGSSTRTGP